MSTGNSRQHSAPWLPFLLFCFSLYGWGSARLPEGGTGHRVLVLPTIAQSTAVPRTAARYASAEAPPDEGAPPGDVSQWKGISRSLLRRPKRTSRLANAAATTWAQQKNGSPRGAAETKPFPTETGQTGGHVVPGAPSPEEDMMWALPGAPKDRQVDGNTEAISRPRRQSWWRTAASRVHPYFAGQQQEIDATELPLEQDNGNDVAAVRRGYPDTLHAPSRIAGAKNRLTQHKLALSALLGGVLVAALLGGVVGARYARKRAQMETPSSAWSFLSNPEKLGDALAKRGEANAGLAGIELTIARFTLALVPLLAAFFIPYLAFLYFAYMYISSIAAGKNMLLELEPLVRK